ncbi:hypothetical protein Thiowin_02682 [Thiorhodovibrio winogradskyi]|uniref:Uncharacterized protein n=1 Tax=Thiorhodovibrio winogradskyi TaxID=77007 RepID=A0ABZ0SC73_9GAMM
MQDIPLTSLAKTDLHETHQMVIDKVIRSDPKAILTRFVAGRSKTIIFA